MSDTRECVVVDAIRTPIGKAGGGLSMVRADDLAAHAIRGLLERVKIDPALVDDVFFGCANQSGEDGRNVGRMALLLAGLPHTVPGVTINRLCASGLESIHLASRAIECGDAEICVAGGVESMTRAPLVMDKGSSPFARGNRVAYDTSLGWRFPNPRMEKLFPLESMGETAENIAERYEISRSEQDEFAAASHRKACEAMRAGGFNDEIVPVPLPGSAKDAPPAFFSRDEGPREDASIGKLAKLRPAFREGGSVTAGNSSSLNDGAAAVLVMSARKARELGLKPMARLRARAVCGVDPRMMGIGPVPATREIFRKTGLGPKDLDLIELNEAFAVQSLAVIRDLELDASKVNLRGGAIALGHPLGCSGARIVATLLHALRARGGRYGLASLCVGVGQGVSALFERVD